MPEALFNTWKQIKLGHGGEHLNNQLSIAEKESWFRTRGLDPDEIPSKETLIQKKMQDSDGVLIEMNLGLLRAIRDAVSG